MAAFSRIKIAGMNPAPHLVLVGPMGAGKTSIGRKLADRMGLPFTDVDEEIERRAGTRVSTIFDCEGEAGFRARERAALVEMLAADGLLVATGGGAVLDPDNRRLLRARGFVVWLQVGVGEQLERLARDHTRPLLQRDDRTEVLRQMAVQREPLYAEVADLCFDTNHLSAAEAASALGKQLSDLWQRGAVAA